MECDKISNPSVGIIRINAPYVAGMSDHVRLFCDVVFKDEKRQIWFQVSEEFGQYLCFERSDAFLIALLPIAMRERCDIVCEAPVGEQLLYQIRTFLVPALTRASKYLYETKIIADIAAPMANAGAVGTGLSCGVDSLYAVAKHWKCGYPDMELTHLTFYNVGAFDHIVHGDFQKKWQLSHAKEFCKEYGFKFVETDSNLADAFPIAHLYAHTFRNCFAVYALQKLWRTYYIGSAGVDFSHFSVTDCECDDCAHYDLLTLDVFSTSELRLYSDGGAIDRFAKTEMLVDFQPAQKYLHVCLSDNGQNCGVCMKCRRTLVTLDAIDMKRRGVLNAFSSVFDVLYYRQHRKDYVRWLLCQKYGPHGDRTVDAVYKVFYERDKLIVLKSLPSAMLSVGISWMKFVIKQVLIKNALVERFFRRMFGRPHSY